MACEKRKIRKNGDWKNGRVSSPNEISTALTMGSLADLLSRRYQDLYRTGFSIALPHWSFDFR